MTVATYDRDALAKSEAVCSNAFGVPRREDTMGFRVPASLLAGGLWVGLAAAQPTATDVVRNVDDQTVEWSKGHARAVASVYAEDGVRVEPGGRPVPEHSAAQSTGPRAAPTPSRTSHGWPVLDRLQHLCDGHVTSMDRSQISWTVFTSRESPEWVLAAYKSQLGDQGLERLANGEWIFRVESEGRVRKVLSITANAPPPARDQCPEAPKGTRTFVMFSDALYLQF